MYFSEFALCSTRNYGTYKERMEGEAWNEYLPPYEKAELDALERVVGDATAEAVPVTFALLKRITNDFSTEYTLGEGGFARVYLVSTIKLLSR
jgi:hypothetical protein